MELGLGRAGNGRDSETLGGGGRGWGEGNGCCLSFDLHISIFASCVFRSAQAEGEFDWGPVGEKHLVSFVIPTPPPTPFSPFQYFIYPL